MYPFINYAVSFCYITKAFPGIPDGSAGKESARSAGDTGDAASIPGSGRAPGGGKWEPTPVFLPEKSHEQRSLAGCSPKGHKESDTTEQLSSKSMALSLWTWK